MGGWVAGWVVGWVVGGWWLVVGGGGWLVVGGWSSLARPGASNSLSKPGIASFGEEAVKISSLAWPMWPNCLAALLRHQATSQY